MKKSGLRRAFCGAICLPVFALSFGAKAGDSKTVHPMDKVSWLVGNWTFEDAQVNGEYWERGSRDCVKVLHDQYIRCESKGLSNKGHERSYYFILGYNKIDKRYEMVGLTSSYPRQNLYIIEPSEDGHTLELKNHFWTSDGLTLSNNATIRYNGTDEYVWRIRNGDMDPETGEKAVGFVDTVRRVK